MATQITTGSNGTAQVTATANGIAGPYSVSPAVSGLGSTANFALTNSTANTTITASNITSPAYGTSATATITVSSSNAGVSVQLPSGNVLYTIDNGTALSATLNSGAVVLTLPATLALGTHAIAVSYAGDSDYKAATNIQFQVMVAAATLTITANSTSKVYGTANPSFTGTITGQQNGDTFTEGYSTTAITTSQVGAYSIVPSAIGTDISDYQQVVNDGTLTVVQASTTTTISASAGAITPLQSVTLSAVLADASL